MREGHEGRRGGTCDEGGVTRHCVACACTAGSFSCAIREEMGRALPCPALAS